MDGWMDGWMEGGVTVYVTIWDGSRRRAWILLCKQCTNVTAGIRTVRYNNSSSVA